MLGNRVIALDDEDDLDGAFFFGSFWLTFDPSFVQDKVFLGVFFRCPIKQGGRFWAVDIRAAFFSLFHS